MADKTEILQKAIIELSKLNGILRDHSARINVLTVAVGFLLGGEHAPEVIQKLDEQRQRLLQSPADALTPDTVAAMMAALKSGNFGRA